MAITVYAISVDCADAEKVAGFWSAALGRARTGPTAIEAGQGPAMLFHQVPEAKTVKNRWHLDLVTSETEAETRRLLGLGATVLRVFEENGQHRWTTFADPEGNEFDLVTGS
jgi:predicted enzyme related to lactoylglutathione lyase